MDLVEFGCQKQTDSTQKLMSVLKLLANVDILGQIGDGQVECLSSHFESFVFSAEPFNGFLEKLNLCLFLFNLRLFFHF